jgi:signal transduction histidine kinase
LKIGAKIAIALAIPIILIGTLAGFSFRMQDEFAKVHEYNGIMYAPAVRALILITDDFALIQDIIKHNPDSYTKQDYDAAFERQTVHFSDFHNAVDAKDSRGSYILSDEKRSEYHVNADSMRQALLAFDGHAREILEIRTSDLLGPAEKDRLVGEELQLADGSALEFRSDLGITRNAVELDDLAHREELLITKITSAEVLSVLLIAATIGSAAIASTTVRGVTRRITLLRNATRQIGQREYKAPLNVSGSDEVGQLARDFEEMRKKIQDFEENLNSLVAERTKELADANAELQRMDAMKEEFINVAAHELRTPLLPLTLGAEALAETYPEDENVKRIYRNAIRITRLTNDILDASKMETGNLRLLPQDTNIVKLVDELMKDYETKLGSHVKLVLDNRLPLERSNIPIDRIRITQVISNLLGNAIKFTESGQIRITIEDNVDSVKISVSDEGKGIDPALMSKLFDKFVSSSEKGGAGLGLYVSRGIIEAHGGRIWAQNNNPKGATFLLTLPYGQAMKHGD